MSKESKHDHKATKCLKTWIFSLVMLAPFFAIGVKCYYVANNENAKESYRGTYYFNSYIPLNNFYPSTDRTWVDNGNNNATLTNDKLLNTMTISNNGTTNTKQLGININPIGFDISTKEYLNTQATFNYDYNNVKSIYITNNGSNFNVTFGTTIFTSSHNFGGGYYGVTKTYTANDYLEIISIENTYYSRNSTNGNNTLALFSTMSYYVDTTLSSVFYSSIQELDKASIFSWTTDTGTYTAVNNMCKTLGIVSPPLAVLITYWTLISVIYIIIDIVLETLIYLTHWINDKMI